jgi:hypothetical protein
MGIDTIHHQTFRRSGSYRLFSGQNSSREGGVHGPFSVKARALRRAFACGNCANNDHRLAPILAAKAAASSNGILVCSGLAGLRRSRCQSRNELSVVNSLRTLWCRRVLPISSTFDVARRVFRGATQLLNSAGVIWKMHLRRLVFGDKNSIVALQ